MGIVSYDGQKLIPAPFISINKERWSGARASPCPTRSPSPSKEDLRGQGSPNSTGVFWDLSGYPPDEDIAANSRLGSIMRKQKAIETLFGTDGKTFEVQSDDGSAPQKFSGARVMQLEFADGQWFNTCDYTIQLQAYEEGVQKASEEWNIETLDEKLRTYRLTHSVSATAFIKYDATGAVVNTHAWEESRDHVLEIIGLGLQPDKMFAAGVLDGNSLQAFNYLRSQHISESEGVFAVTETWVAYDPAGQPPAYVEQNVNVKTDSTGKTTVSVEGTITGLEQRDNNTFNPIIKTRYANAQDKWSNYVFPSIAGTAETVSGVTLNPVPLNSSVGINEVAGTIQFSYEYDNRPLLAPGFISEAVTVADSHAADVFAQIPVLGRPLGPVLQSIGTVTARKRNISIDIQMRTATIDTPSPVAPDTNVLVLSLLPPFGTALFMENDEESWTPNTGRYTRTTSFVWE
jgi:hypothetical protein